MLQRCYFVQVMNRNNGNALPHVCKNFVENSAEKMLQIFQIFSEIIKCYSYTF